MNLIIYICPEKKLKNTVCDAVGMTTIIENLWYHVFRLLFRLKWRQITSNFVVKVRNNRISTMVTQVNFLLCSL